MMINVIGSPPEGDFSLLHLSGVISGTFQPLLASYDLFRVIPFFTSNNVTECFTMNQREWVIDFGNLLLYSPNTLPLQILEKLKFSYIQKNEKITTPTRHICITCIPEKQIIGGVSCTENC